MVQEQFENISIIGDGAMGTTLACLLCEKGIRVKMWGHDAAQLERFKLAGENTIFLPGYKLADELIFEADDNKIFSEAELTVSAVPCIHSRSVWSRLKGVFPVDVPIVTITKGIETDTGLRADQILESVLGSGLKIVALSGPNIADEIMRKLPATAAVACEDTALAEKVQRTFSTDFFRIYTNDDVTGVELAGAMKNVIAIAAGILDGIGAGDNAKAALLTRGIAEITRLGVACGAKAQTFAGLTGLGDLVTTCYSPKGRNRSFGQRIGEGLSVDEAKNATESVIEGFQTCRAVVELAKKKNVEMPITDAVYQVLFENKSVKEALADLMTRQLKAE